LPDGQRGVRADAVDVFELYPGFAPIDAVDREAHRGNVAGLDDALGGLALSGCHPLLPGRRDLVQKDAAARAIIGTVAPHANTRMSEFSSSGVKSGGLPIPISL